MNSPYAKTSLRKSAPGKASPSVDAKKKRRFKIGAALLMVLVVAAWFFWPSSQVAAVRQMQAELFSADPSAMSPEERKEKFAALRAEQEKLSDEERNALRKEMGKLFQKKRNAEAAKYLAMAPADRRKLIDERIVKEQARQQKGAQGGGGPKGGPGSGNGPGGAGAGQGGPPGGPRGGGSPEERDAMRRDFLLSATPEARAGMDQMRMDMAVRRTELGLPPPVRGLGR